MVSSVNRNKNGSLAGTNFCQYLQLIMSSYTVSRFAGARILFSAKNKAAMVEKVPHSLNAALCFEHKGDEEVAWRRLDNDGDLTMRGVVDLTPPMQGHGKNLFVFCVTKETISHGTFYCLLFLYSLCHASNTYSAAIQIINGAAMLFTSGITKLLIWATIRCRLQFAFICRNPLGNLCCTHAD